MLHRDSALKNTWEQTEIVKRYVLIMGLWVHSCRLWYLEPEASVFGYLMVLGRLRCCAIPRTLGKSGPCFFAVTYTSILLPEVFAKTPGRTTQSQNSPPPKVLTENLNLKSSNPKLCACLDSGVRWAILQRCMQGSRWSRSEEKS